MKKKEFEKTRSEITEFKIELVKLEVDIENTGIGHTLEIKLSGLSQMDVLFIERALDDYYILQEGFEATISPESKKEFPSTLYRWDIIRDLRNALRKECEGRLISKPFPTERAFVP